MNSIGVFREGEIDGKPFHIYTLSSQTDNISSSSFSSSSGEAAIDSGGGDNNLTFQPLYICPSLRLKAERLKREEYGVLPFNTSPYFPSIGSPDQQVQLLLDFDSHEDICKLLVAPLFWCNNKEPNADDYFINCPACLSPEIGNGYYLCVTCDSYFHKECVESPFSIKHPSYPFLSIQLYNPSKNIRDPWSCICCEKPLNYMAYHCPTYNLSIHQVFLMKSIPIVIDQPRRHPHSLTFFPKKNSLAYDVCGLIKESFPTYVCVRCAFVVHQDCIYFPYVIRISRHQHRISFTSSLPSGKWSCGVCRQKVDNDCGVYSCNKCDDYFVHSRCALRRDLWDGEELEGVPEEHEIGLEPFERIAEGIILHFSHDHHLKFEISRVYDEEKFCQACVLPIYEGNCYTCMDECEFILHETCANAPLKKHHALHAQPLMLKVVTNRYEKKGYFRCDACRRISSGFVYENLIGNWGFKLDLRCASISKPFEYQGHEHPLFLALKPEKEKYAICKICKDDGYLCKKLNCIECDYIICFKCATLPYKAMYKHDKHFLTLRKGKEGSYQSGWCDVCESKIVYSRKGGFYSCDEYCCTTLHVHCLLGKDQYMKPGQTIKFQRKLLILRNNTQSQPFCYGHNDLCRYKVVFQDKNNVTFCSLSCSC